MDLKEAVKNLPRQPGIYQMKDSLGNIIYIGKARDLKARVSQYFRKNAGSSPKVKEMVEQICSFDYIAVDTELEAFLLECKTIRELKPKYNRQLKNSGGYKYIRLSTGEEYPKISMTTHVKRDKARYFGPFTSESSVRNTLQFINEYYLIRKCSRGVFVKASPAGEGESHGCLYFNFGNCLGPCRGKDVREEYLKQIYNIIQFLEGNDSHPLRELHDKMDAASECLNFEKAAQFRDQIRGVRHVLNKQKVIKISGYGRNTLAGEKSGETGAKLFFIKGNKLLHTELIDLAGYDHDKLEGELKDLILNVFAGFSRDWAAALSQEEIDEAQIIHSYLKNRKNGIWSVNIPISRINSLNFAKIVDMLYKNMRADKLQK